MPCVSTKARQHEVFGNTKIRGSTTSTRCKCYAFFVCMLGTTTNTTTPATSWQVGGCVGGSNSQVMLGLSEGHAGGGRRPLKPRVACSPSQNHVVYWYPRPPNGLQLSCGVFAVTKSCTFCGPYFFVQNCKKKVFSRKMKLVPTCRMHKLFKTDRPELGKSPPSF